MPNESTPGRLLLDFHLHRDGCRNTPPCRHLTRGLLETCASLKLVEPADGTTEANNAIHALAVLDLNSYRNFEEVIEAARTVTQKRGRAKREIDRARRAGYYVKRFPIRQHTPDLIDIHRSRPPRPENSSDLELQTKDVDSFGGVASERIKIESPDCRLHYSEYWGVFLHEDGHCQGTVQTDERLVGYIYLIRAGDSAWYNGIMGHAHHLPYGIMYLLHYHLVEEMMLRRPEGLRYLVFYQYARHACDEAAHWKRLALFRPYYLIPGDEQCLRMPARLPMPHLAEALWLLKQSSDLHGTDIANVIRESGIAPEWFPFLQRAWLIQEARAPGLLSSLLRSGPTPSLDLLRQFSSSTFPVEILETNTNKITIILNGDDRGLDTLLPLHDYRAINVTVYHSSPAELEALRATYSDAWEYVLLPNVNVALAPPFQTSDLIIVEPPLLGSAEFLRSRLGALSSRPRILVSVEEALLVLLGCETFDTGKLSRRFSWFFQRELRCSGIYFRFGIPNLVFWVFLEANEQSA